MDYRLEKQHQSFVVPVQTIEKNLKIRVIKESPKSIVSFFKCSLLYIQNLANLGVKARLDTLTGIWQHNKYWVSFSRCFQLQQSNVYICLLVKFVLCNRFDTLFASFTFDCLNMAKILWHRLHTLKLSQCKQVLMVSSLLSSYFPPHFILVRSLRLIVNSKWFTPNDMRGKRNT